MKLRDNAELYQEVLGLIWRREPTIGGTAIETASRILDAVEVALDALANHEHACPRSSDQRRESTPCWCHDQRHHRALASPSPGTGGAAGACETCKGAREVLRLYNRGSSSPPGNQMIPCPTCRPAPEPVKPPATCGNCEIGFPLNEDGMHYGTQRLGMIPLTPCTARAPAAEPPAPTPMFDALAEMQRLGRWVMTGAVPPFPEGEPPSKCAVPAAETRCKECRCSWLSPHAPTCSLGATVSETESWKFETAPAAEPGKPATCPEACPNEKDCYAVGRCIREARP